MSNLSISCCRSTNYGLWVLKCTELIRKRKGTLWELTNGILKFSSASFYYRDWSRNFQRVLEWTLCGVVWARSRFLGKTLHSDSASPYLGLWIKCFNQSVSQSINQSINRSIDRSINRSINQSINQSIDQSIDRSIDQSSKQASKQASQGRLFKGLLSCAALILGRCLLE